jgi:thiol:disulfide interchange protein
LYIDLLQTRIKKLSAKTDLQVSVIGAVFSIFAGIVVVIVILAIWLLDENFGVASQEGIVLISVIAIAVIFSISATIAALAYR